MTRTHRYRTQLEWIGNQGTGTADYASYGRDCTIAADGKGAAIDCSADPAFRGDPARYNPEELLVAALSSCHMLSYLAFAALNGVTVIGYRDSAEGEMEEAPGGVGRFTRVTLRPKVTLAAGADVAKAEALHERAHEACFLARSVNFAVIVEAKVGLEQNSQ